MGPWQPELCATPVDSRSVPEANEEPLRIGVRLWSTEAMDSLNQCHRPGFRIASDLASAGPRDLGRRPLVSRWPFGAFDP